MVRSFNEKSAKILAVSLYVSLVGFVEVNFDLSRRIQKASDMRMMKQRRADSIRAAPPNIVSPLPQFRGDDGGLDDVSECCLAADSHYRPLWSGRRFRRRWRLMLFSDPAKRREFVRLIRDVFDRNPDLEFQVAGTDVAIMQVSVAGSPKLHNMPDLFHLPDGFGDGVLDSFRDRLVIRTTRADAGPTIGRVVINRVSAVPEPFGKDLGSAGVVAKPVNKKRSLTFWWHVGLGLG